MTRSRTFTIRISPGISPREVRETDSYRGKLAKSTLVRMWPNASLVRPKRGLWSPRIFFQMTDERLAARPAALPFLACFGPITPKHPEGLPLALCGLDRP